MIEQEPQSHASLVDDADYLLEKIVEVKEAAEVALEAHLDELHAFRSNEDAPSNISAEDIPGLEESQRLEPIPQQVLEIEETVTAAKEMLHSPLGSHPSIREAISDVLGDATQALKEAASTVNDTSSNNIGV